MSGSSGAALRETRDPSVPEQSGRRGRVRADRRTLLVLGLAALVAVVLPLGLAVASGSLSIPHNDAWAYSRIAQTFARTGHIQLLSWNRSALIGQFIVLGPLAASLTVQQLYVALLALVALYATYDLLVPSIGRRRSAFAALTMAVWPGFGLLSTTFMADVPALAAMTLSLTFGRRALAQHSTRMLALSMAFGVWGVTIREQVLAAPVAVLLVLALHARRRGTFRRRVLIANGAAFGLAVLAFELWRRSLPDGDPPQIESPHLLLQTLVHTSVQAYFTLALAVVPAVFLVARPWTWRRGTWLVALAVAVVAALTVADYGQLGFFLPNYIAPGGPYWGAGNGVPSVFPLSAWPLVVTLACVSGVLMAGVLVRRIRDLDPLLGVFALLVVLGTFGAETTGQSVFDRYCLMVMAPLLAVLLAESRTPAPGRLHTAQRTVAGLLTLVVTLFSLAITASGMAYDTVRWRTAQRLADAGAPVEHIDAGLEWNGTHSSQRLALIGMIEFPSMVPCFLETATPEKTGSPYQVVHYRTFGLFGSSDLLVYNQDLTACGTHNGTTAVTTETGVTSTARIDAQGALWVANQADAGGPFTGWTRIGTGGGLAGAPAMLVSVAASGTQSVFVRTAGGAIGYYSHTVSGWQDRQLLSGGPVFAGDPAVVLTPAGGMSVSAVDTAGDVWVDTQVLPGTPFGGWQRMSTGGGLAGTPAMLVSPAGGGTQNVFVRTAQGAIGYFGQSGPSWRPRALLPGGPVFASDPAVTLTTKGGMSVSAVDTAGDLWVDSQKVAGEAFTGWQRVSTSGGQQGTPAIALSSVRGGTENLFARTADGTIARFEQNGSGWHDRQLLVGGPAFVRGPAVTLDGNGTMTVTAVDATGATWATGEQVQGGPFNGWVKIS